MCNKVFIIEPLRPELDASKAKTFGLVKYLFDYDSRRCSIFQHDKFGQTVLEKLHEYEYDPVNDYVCVAGSMLAVTIAAIVLAQTYDEFNLLLFNSSEDKYISKTFKKSDWFKGDDDGENKIYDAEKASTIARGD